jgi:hypothetical protein
VTIINLISLFVFIGLPIIAAIAYLGLDLSRAKDLLPFIVKNPSELVSKYLGLFFLVGMSFIFYLIFTSILFLYTLGGTLGVLKSSAVNIQYKFRLSSFFKEANINFWRLLWLVSIAFLGVIVVFLILMISGAIVAAIQHAFTGVESTLEMFFSSFVMLTVIIFSIIIVLVGFIFAVYSVVILIIEGNGVTDSIRRTFIFLKQTPQALLFYLILLIGMISASAVLYGLQISFSAILVMAPLIYIVNALFQNYLVIFIWSSLIVYYIKGSNYPVYDTEYEI